MEDSFSRQYLRAELLVSIHCNASTTVWPDDDFTTLWGTDQKPDYARKSRFDPDELFNRLQRKQHDANFSVLCNCPIPAALKLLISNSKKKSLAELIFQRRQLKLLLWGSKDIYPYEDNKAAAPLSGIQVVCIIYFMVMLSLRVKDRRTKNDLKASLERPFNKDV